MSRSREKLPAAGISSHPRVSCEFFNRNDFIRLCAIVRGPPFAL